jgi:hypothetical protein
MNDAGIVRNRLKIESAVVNAQALSSRCREEFGSFSAYVWRFVAASRSAASAAPGVPARTECPDALSKDLKRRGFKFVGSTIIYAFMQATGLANDHRRTMLPVQMRSEMKRLLLCALLALPHRGGRLRCQRRALGGKELGRQEGLPDACTASRSSGNRTPPTARCDDAQIALDGSQRACTSTSRTT